MFFFFRGTREAVSFLNAGGVFDSETRRKFFPQKKALSLVVKQADTLKPPGKGKEIYIETSKVYDNTLINSKKKVQERSDADRGGAEEPGRISNVFDMPRDLQSAV